MSAFPEDAVHKVVPLKFAGVDLKLKTSHALFSAHHVDDGTMLLLKTLAQQNAVPPAGRVLDAGCGYGPLALALKKYRPVLEVTARDRLALAASFTAENARLNGLAVDAAPGLLLEAVPGPWDLIVSNIPAKAGEPVLADFVRRSLGLLAPGGRCAVVIVATLAPWLADELARSGAEVVHDEEAAGYRVFHWKAPAGAAPAAGPAFPGAYARSEVRWACGPRSFVQKTVYGLPNFDALDFRLQVSLPLLEKFQPRGDTLVWEPVQGHLATWADAVLGPGDTLVLGGNDALGLAAASRNVPRRVPLVRNVPTLGDLDLGPGSLGAALVQLHPEPEVPWVDDVREALLRFLAPGAPVLVNGSSTDLTRFLERHKGLRKLRDERTKGWRACVLERQKEG
jgi:SAM-dependent methyltransferase